MTIDPRITKAVKGADAVTWDGCHKIYIPMGSQVEYMEELGYEVLRIGEDLDEAAAATLLQSWYDESCSLRFIQKVSPPGNNENFTSIISQFEGE